MIALVVPAAAQAKGGGEVRKDVGKAAKQHCKALRAGMGVEAFRSAFAGKDGKRAMKRCVKTQRKLARSARKRARSACRAEGKRGHALKRCIADKTRAKNSASPDAFKNAAAKCQAEQAEDPEAFADEYGDGPNAFGKCVSEHADEEAGDDEPGEDEADDSENEDEPGEDEPAGPDGL